MFTPDKKNGTLKLLIIHQNFPSQYLHIARHYAANENCEVMVLTRARNETALSAVAGVTVCRYGTPPEPEGEMLALDYERQVRRGLCVAAALQGIRERGFLPDVILAHAGWGEGLFIRTVFPHTPVMAYAETYGRPNDPILDFDPEFPCDPRIRPLVMAKNAGSALTFAEADRIQVPTLYQMTLLPAVFRNRAMLLYDGIDTDDTAPAPEASFTVPPAEAIVSPEVAALPSYVPRRREPLRLTAEDEVISFVCRTLEPHLGWHTFIRALPLIQKRFPRAHCVVVGRTADGYGSPPSSGRNWRDVFLDEVRDQIDFLRLHFAGTLPRGAVLDLLRITRAHVYLPYPFWLSYSPVEAMSCGAPLVAAATGPVLELVEDGKDGMLVDFHSPDDIAGAVCTLLETPALRASLGREARKKAVETYDLKRVWLPRWDEAIRTLAAGKRPRPY